MIQDRGTYKYQNEIKCCENCRYSYTTRGITLLCKNTKEWIKESSVRPLGICESFEIKTGENDEE